MKLYLKNTIAIILGLLSFLELASCRKDTTGAEISLTYQMLSNKSWFLDYSITGVTKKSYVGQTTYFIDFLTDKTTRDSDGVAGTYVIEKVGNNLQIHVQGKTSKGNIAEFIYTIEYIGSNKLVVNYSLPNSSVSTRLYFSSKN